MDRPEVLIAGAVPVLIANEPLKRLTVPERGTSTRGKQKKHFAADVNELRKHLSIASEERPQLFRETSSLAIFPLNQAEGPTRPIKLITCSAGTPGVKTMLAFHFDVSGETRSPARIVESVTLLLQHLRTSGAK